MGRFLAVPLKKQSEANEERVSQKWAGLHVLKLCHESESKVNSGMEGVWLFFGERLICCTRSIVSRLGGMALINMKTTRAETMKTYRLSLGGVFLCAVVSLFGSYAKAENALSVGKGSAPSNSVADIPLSLSGDQDVQGFVMVFEWDGSKGRGIDVLPNSGAGSPLDSADLIVKRVEDAFMVFSVVMDSDGKDGEKITAGQNIKVGTAQIRCTGPASGSVETPITLVDKKHAAVEGGPILSNLISIGGRSISQQEGLRLKNGSFTCEGGVVTGQVVFACGGPLGDDGNPTTQKGPHESQRTETFYYKAPNTGTKERIQGLSMSVSFDCNLTGLPDTLNLDGGALKETNAEFVHLEIDNNASNVDTDGCELTFGTLIDAVAPFDGRTLPATSTFRKLFSVDFQVSDMAACGDCLDIKFKDSLNGNGDVTVKNLVSINFQSSAPQFQNCAICVEGEPSFIRGDCNFSNMGAMAVDIADAAAEVGFLFLEGDLHFNAPCQDACDANDDGRLDAADIVFILNYLFVPKSPKPPPPGAIKAGKDPTRDTLGCDAGMRDCDP